MNLKAELIILFDNIVIAGKNNIAIKVTRFIILNYPDLNIYVIFNHNDNGVDNAWQKSFKKYCSSNHKITPITLEGSYQIHNAIFLSVEFDKIIVPKFFKSTKLYNIHFSYLPFYRGMYTSALPLLYNESTSGVTLHCIDSGIDTGAIIAQEKIVLCNIFCASELYDHYIKKGTELIQSHFLSLLKNNYTAQEQSTLQGSYFSKNTINYESIDLDFFKTSLDVVNQVRAFTFRQYQLIKFNGDNISYAKQLSTKSEREPGVVVNKSKYFYIVSTEDNDVYLAIDKLSELLSMVKRGNINECIKLLKYNPTLALEKDELEQSGVSLAHKCGFISIVKLFESFGSKFDSEDNC